MDFEAAKQRIAGAFASLLSTSLPTAAGLIPRKLTAGKIYEAHVLSRVCEALSGHEGCELILVGGTKIALKSSPGPINHAYPYIQVFRNGRRLGDLYTDVEFTGLSHSMATPAAPPTPGQYHELDIALVDADATGRPRHDQVLLGVECKNTAYNKGLLKEILGVRREMCLLAGSQATRFRRWPAKTLCAQPASCLLVYSTSPAITDYADPGAVFGIHFVHEPL